LKPKKNGSYSGAMVSLDQVATPIPFDKVERTLKRLAFEIKQLGVSFAGDMTSYGYQISKFLKPRSE